MHGINGRGAALINDSIPVSEEKTKQNQFNAPSPKTSPTAAIQPQLTNRISSLKSC